MWQVFDVARNPFAARLVIYAHKNKAFDKFEKTKLENFNFVHLLSSSSSMRIT